MSDLGFFLGFLAWAGGPLAGIALAFCLFLRIFGGRYPAWFYGLAFAWWWPVRRDSALTIAAALLDADTGCREWVENSGYSKWSLRHGATGLKIKYETDGIFPYIFSGLSVKGVEADEDSWGAYCLIKSVKAWGKRQRVMEIEQAERGAAEAVLRAYKRVWR